jgi:hypothetical protein
MMVAVAVSEKVNGDLTTFDPGADDERARVIPAGSQEQFDMQKLTGVGPAKMAPVIRRTPPAAPVHGNQGGDRVCPPGIAGRKAMNVKSVAALVTERQSVLGIEVELPDEGLSGPRFDDDFAERVGRGQQVRVRRRDRCQNKPRCAWQSRQWDQ